MAKLTPKPSFRVLTEFQHLFDGREYRHRSANQGDFVAMHLFEDLIALGRSPKLLEAVKAGRSVVNTQNVRRGVKARRGDGTLGEIVPDGAARRVILSAAKNLALKPDARCSFHIPLPVHADHSLNSLAVNWRGDCRSA